MFRKILTKNLGYFKILNGNQPCITRNIRSMISQQYSLIKDDNASSDVKPEKSDQLLQSSAKELLENAATFSDADPLTIDDIWSTSVYPEGVNVERDQAKHSVRPKTDPRKTSVLCFPGQGSQVVGMGSDLISYDNVPKMFEIASDILKFDLLHLCINGPISQLNKTENCQAAIFVHSLAVVERLKTKDPEAVSNCIAALGFSSGEYAALVFAGALSFQDGVKLLKIRGQAMQAASEMQSSGMMTIFTRPEAKTKFICHSAKEWCIRQGINNPVCSVANYLFPQCKVIAGNEEALQFIEINANDLGIRRLKRLAVSGAFHTHLMKPAESVLRAALEKVSFSKPLISVHSNVNGQSYRDPNNIVKQLTQQLCNPVKWEQTMHIIYERSSDTPFPKTFECGPGQSLRAILKQVNLKAWNNSFTA